MALAGWTGGLPEELTLELGLELVRKRAVNICGNKVLSRREGLGQAVRWDVALGDQIPEGAEGADEERGAVEVEEVSSSGGARSLRMERLGSPGRAGAVAVLSRGVTWSDLCAETSTPASAGGAGCVRHG